MPRWCCASLSMIGVTPRDIKISAGEALRADLQRRESVNTILSELIGQIFDHDTLAYSVARYEELLKTQELLGDVEKNTGSAVAL